MVGQLTVAKELGQHGKSARSESLIDERLLPVQGLNRRAARQRIFAGIRVGDLRVEFTDRSQPVRLPAIACIERLAKNILSAGRIIAQIKPIIGLAQSSRKGIFNGFARAASIDTTDHKIRAPVMPALQRARMEVIWDRRPTRTPEQVDAVDESTAALFWPMSEVEKG